MTSRVRFRVASSLGCGLIVGMLLLFVLAGQAFPVQIGNVGPITMSAPSLATKQFQLSPGGTDVPQSTTDLSGQGSVGTMTASGGVVMEKSFDLGNVLPGAGTWRVKMAMGGPVQGANIALGTQQLCAGESTLHTLQVKANGGNAGLSLSAGDGTLSDARLAVTSLSASSLSVQSLNISLGRGDVDQQTTGCLTNK